MTNASAPSGRVQVLSFQLGGLDYGLDFSRVQELREFKSLERFAAEGAIISGVAVSRGVIMPIVDMRVAVAGQPPATRPHTDVIILALSSCVMGMVVDGVTDVLWLDPARIEPIAGASAVDYLLGVAQCEGRRLILIDIDKLMSIRRAAQAA